MLKLKAGFFSSVKVKRLDYSAMYQTNLPSSYGNRI